MHHANNAVIMQTEQLGQIEALEEELRSSKAKMVEMEQKMTEQDRVIAQLVGDNLDHLQDNMWLTAHINSSQERMAQMEHRLGQVGSVVMGFLEGRLESLMEEEREEGTTESSSSSEVRTSGASGVIPEDQGGDEDNAVVGVSPQESMRQDSPMPREEGLITQMEREAEAAGLGGWFNGNLEDVPESWSGSNSDASASQDQVWTTLLTTIGSRTLPDPVRVPDNLVQPAVLRDLMEGPVRPWQVLVWAEQSPPQYSQDLPLLHMSGPSHTLLQVSLYYEDLEGEYRGGVVEEEQENEGGDASVE